MLIFLKLGGSLITNKSVPYTPRTEIIDSIAAQVARFLERDREVELLIGHGSGSFGHEAAGQLQTMARKPGTDLWHGFSEVWYQASTLNRLVTEAFRRTGLAVVSISPFSSVVADNGEIDRWDISPIRNALDHHILPIIYGDIVFDSKKGWSILSTEMLFDHLLDTFHPRRILLAGMEEGVWKDYPDRNHLVSEITPKLYETEPPSWGDIAGMDVTGGMRSKVEDMLNLVKREPDLQVHIFSGKDPKMIHRALNGENMGTLIHG